jgi:DNA-binding PadR family transcriptional regulator
MILESMDADAQAALSPATFHVLLALAEDDLHGYAILKSVERQTEGGVSLSTGTLYGILKRLLAEGWIAERRARPAAEQDDGRRRYYRLTPQGRRVAAAEAGRLDRLVTRARAQRLLSRPKPA